MKDTKKQQSKEQPIKKLHYTPESKIEMDKMAQEFVDALNKGTSTEEE